MNISRRKFIPAVLFPVVIDHVVTVIGQPSQYWQDFSFAREGSPARFLLEQHPGWFLLWGAVYIVLLALLLRVLPKKIALFVGLLVYTGHAWGSSSWIPRLLSMTDFTINHWYVTIGYFAVLSLVLSWGILSWYREK